MLNPDPEARPGVAPVEHDARHTAGREHPPYLRECGRSVGSVVKDAPGIDKVERGVRERQLLRVCDPYLSWKVLERETLPGEVDRRSREIDAGRDCSGSREIDEVRRRSGADLEHPLPTPAREVGKAEDERLRAVPMCLDLFEEGGRAV